MTAMQEAQCIADGRLAFRHGVPIERNPRRGAAQRAAWLRGWEYERGLATGEKATPEQREESRRVAADLKAWAEENL
jgi:hypothetical protein